MEKQFAHKQLSLVFRLNRELADAQAPRLLRGFGAQWLFHSFYLCASLFSSQLFLMGIPDGRAKYFSVTFFLSAFKKVN